MKGDIGPNFGDEIQMLVKRPFLRTGAGCSPLLSQLGQETRPRELRLSHPPETAQNSGLGSERGQRTDQTVWSTLPVSSDLYQSARAWGTGNTRDSTRRNQYLAGRPWLYHQLVPLIFVAAHICHFGCHLSLVDRNDDGLRTLVDAKCDPCQRLGLD
jgi:hypothetical protein